MLACPFDTTYYLRRKCGFDLKMISCLMMSISIVACSGKHVDSLLGAVSFFEFTKQS